MAWKIIQDMTFVCAGIRAGSEAGGCRRGPAHECQRELCWPGNQDRHLADPQGGEIALAFISTFVISS